jgi:hypothetical protein
MFLVLVFEFLDANCLVVDLIGILMEDSGGTISEEVP